MTSVNRIFLIGNLGNDPERKTTRTGTVMVTYPLATHEGWGENQTTHWHQIVAFGKTAEVSEQHLSKGRRVCVEGRVSYSTWEDENGLTRKTTRIIADRVHFISPKAENSDTTDEDSGRRAFAASSIPF